MIVGHRESEGVGELFTHAQALHRGQRVVQGIGVIAAGIYAQRAVEPQRGGLRHKTHHIMQVRVHRRGQHAADSGRILDNGSRGRAHTGQIVGAVDGQGQGIGGRAPVPVRDSEREGIGELFPYSQALHHGQGIIQGVGIMPGSVQSERAVAAQSIVLGNERQNIMDIRICGRRQIAADADHILKNHSRGRGDHRCLVAAVDAHGHNSGSRAAVSVGHGDRKGVGQAVTDSQAHHGGQRGVQGIGIAAVGTQGERAVTARRIALRRETDHVVHIHIRGQRQRAAGNGAVFGNAQDCRDQHGRVVGAVNGQGQAVGSRAPVAVGHCKTERVRELFTHAQTLHRGQRIIQNVGVVARGIHCERAVQACCACLRKEGQHVVHVHIHGHGQRAADADRILGDHGRGRADRGDVVGSVDGQGQGIGNRAAVAVGNREAEGVGEFFTHAQALHRGQRIVQNVGVIARSVQGKRAVQARLVRLREKGQHVMHVHVHGHGQRAADRDRILGDHGCGRADRGYVVGAVNSQGQGVGDRAAVAVRHGKGEGVGKMFPDAQGLYRRQSIVQDIGIIAVGVHCELAVQAHCARLREKSQHIVQIHIRGHGQRAADRDRILGDHGRGHADRGDVVGAVDGHGQGTGDRAAKPVGNRKGEGVGEMFPDAQALHCRQRVVQGIDIAARGIHRERTVEPHCGSLGQIAYDIEQTGVCRRGQQAGNIDAVLGDHIHGRFHAEAAAAPGDRDGQGIGGCAPMPVRHGIGECFGKMLVEQQIDHGEQTGIQRIHIGTVGVEGQPAVAAELIGFRNEGHGVADIRVRGSDEMTRVGNIRLGNRGSGGPHRRRVISAVDGQGQGVRGRAAVTVRDSKGKGIGELVAHAQALHRGQCVVQGVAVIA